MTRSQLFLVVTQDSSSSTRQSRFVEDSENSEFTSALGTVTHDILRQDSSGNGSLKEWVKHNFQTDLRLFGKPLSLCEADCLYLVNHALCQPIENDLLDLQKKFRVLDPSHFKEVGIVSN